MKLQKYLFNTLLRKYNKCKRRLDNLKTANRNYHRQGVLERHITRIYERLMALQAFIKRGAVATGLVLGAMAMQPNGAHAQIIVPTFTTAVVNPFGLTANSDGGYTVPAFADLDNDGDLDMLSGEYYTGSFVYYQNTGSNTSPSFSAAVSNPFGLTNTSSSEYSTPAFVDLDHDGDMDIMAGDESGNFNYYENVGTASAPSFTAPLINPFGTAQINSGSYSHTSFADMDNDGDLDLMASSEGDNNFYYFENTGTNTAPNFAAVVQNPFSLSQGYSWTGAVLGDVDHDGDYDIITQSENGDFYYNANTGTASAPAFAAAVINPFVLGNLNNVNNSRYYSTTFVDLNNDGRLDLMSGDRNGNFIYNKNTPLPAAALSFNGSNNYAGTSIFSTLTNNITLQASVNWSGTTGANQMIITNGNTGTAGYGIYVDNANSDQLSVVLGGLVVMSSNASLSTNIWQNVALVCDAGSWTLYVDGSAYTLSSNTSVPNPVAGAFAIGGDQAGAENFNGSIDEVRFWGRALCQGELQNYVNGELPMPQNNLIAYYKFNEGMAFLNNTSVTTLADSSGNGHNLTLNNFTLNGATSNWVAPGAVTTNSLAATFMTPIITVSGTNFIPVGQTTTLTANGADTYTWSANTSNATTAAVALSPTVTTVYSVQGSLSGCLSNIAIDTVHIGNFPAAALNFDGVDDYVLVNTGSNSLSAPFTVEAWVNPSSVSGYMEIVSTRTPSDNSFDVTLGNGNAIHCDIGDGNGWLNTGADGNFVYNVGQWIHVAVAVTNADYNIYANGILVGNGTFSGTPLLFDANHSITFGSLGGGENFNGNIDEVRIWNRALCQGEIVNNMNGELKLPQTGLMAYYKFDQGAASDNNTAVITAADSSGNGYDGTLTNFDLTTITSNWVAPGAVGTGSYAPVFVIPTLTVTGTTTICEGTTTTLTATGASTYMWTSGSDSDTTMVSPAVGNTTYTVTGSYLGCPPNTAVTTVSVNPMPTVSVSSATICAGADYTISPTGASTYTYMPFGPVVSPTITASYTVTGTDANGCTNMDTLSVAVINCSTGLNSFATNQITVYPNPNNGNFVVTTTENTSNIIVTDILGNVLLSVIPTNTTTNINLSAQPGGIYFIKVISNGAQTVKRIVINN